MFVSTKRALASTIVSLLVEFYAFNFVPRNINLLATRSPLRQVFAYVLNFVIFFVVVYLLLTLLAFALHKKNKN